MEEILLIDYENHMSLDSIMQLQAMSEMTKNASCSLFCFPYNGFGGLQVMVLNIFRKTNLKEYMELTSTLPICRQSYKGIRN